MAQVSVLRVVSVVALVATLGVVAGSASHSAAASPTVTQQDLVGPAGSTFGERVVVLENGNYVVVDSEFDSGANLDVGAVHLYDGVINTVIDTVTGTTPGDRIGSSGVIEVGASNYVIISPEWDDGATVDVGAVTFGDGTTGVAAVAGAVSTANSLHGTTTGDAVGSFGVTALTNGNYVINTPEWDDEATADVGAVTFADGTVGITGPVTTANSLHGSSPSDRVGGSLVTALANGNYTVASSVWDDGATADVGAVTFADGTVGITGAVTTANSLHGTTPSDRVGNPGVTALANGNYTVASYVWDDEATADVGAVTFADGTVGITGAVTTANSLHGTTPSDRVGDFGVTALANGNYTATSRWWDNGATADVGAVTFADGTAGMTGAVSVTNSLHGTSPSDRVGGSGVTALANGNFAVASSEWDNGATTQVGAVTFADGIAGIVGAVTTANSLHGTTTGDRVGGSGVIALTNGSYVVPSQWWDNGATNAAGAVTFGDGTTGVAGAVTTANSLHGTTPNDQVGGSGVTALANGNYTVASSAWDDGTTANVGAVTFGDGTTGVVGPVTTANSLHGTTTGDRVGSSDGVAALTNGNYTVASSAWDDGTTANVGAVTFGDGTTGVVGPVTTANSLHGTTAGDFVGGSGVTGLINGNYTVTSPRWDDGATVDAGAVTFGVATGGVVGPIDSSNSAIGTPSSAIGIPPGSVLVPGDRLTSNDALPIPTTQNRVLLLQLDLSAPVVDVVSLDPARLLDTRPTGETIDDRFDKVGKLGAGGVIELDVLDRGGVPDSDVSAVVLNVTMIRPDSNGFVTIFPCGTRPLASSMNASAGGDVVANEVIAKLSPAGTVCIYTSTPTNFAADITAYIPTSSQVVSLDPARLLDTRPTGETIDDRFDKVGKLGAGGVIELDVLDRGGVPDSDVSAVVLNVTMIRPDSNGFVTIFPCGTRPLASSMNASAGGDVVANEVIAKLSPAGTVCIYTSTPTNFAADITAYIPTSSQVVSLDPARLLDTRPTGETIDDRFDKVGKLGAGGVIELDVLDRGGVPDSDVSAVVLNVTMIRPDSNGFVTIFPCGTRPLASSMNASAGGDVVANEVIAKLSPAGTVCIYTSTPTNFAADITAYIVN